MKPEEFGRIENRVGRGLAYIETAWAPETGPLVEADLVDGVRDRVNRALRDYDVFSRLCLVFGR